MSNRNVPISRFLVLLAVLLSLMTIPRGPTKRVNGFAIATLAPLWQSLIQIKLLASSVTSKEEEEACSEEKGKDLKQVELENALLKSELHQLQQLFQQELIIIADLSKIVEESDAAIQNHQETLLSRVQNALQTIPAKVLYRPPNTWGSSLWIDVGEKHNNDYNEPIIQRNSPVVIGHHVIGVIDYVGNSTSRVRLITDSGLTPSVRASRGLSQKNQIKEAIQVLSGLLVTTNDLFSSPSQKKTFLEILNGLKNKIGTEEENWLLAKGELLGASAPLWRADGQKLKGIGFNYDFSDSEGPARDLRTGEPIHAPESIPTLPILQKGDLLVTTGFDGIFPPGLSVATVTLIQLLKEGDYYYELEAIPTAGNLNELEMVYILPPVSPEITSNIL